MFKSRYNITSILNVLCFFALFISNAQTKSTITGKITSESGKALEGVTIVVKNEYKGTVTNTNGEFVLDNVGNGNHIVQASFLGYTTQEKNINIASTNYNIDIVLKTELLEMNAVELTGKSKIRKINEQSYSVTSVSTKNLLNSSSDAKQILDRVPGVRILQEGGLGSNLSFSLNGFKGNQIKFFLDGVPMDNFGASFNLSSIPVNTIERIDVYKGVVPVWLGTDALGGAINIITNQSHNFLDTSYSYGSFNTHKASVNGAYTNPKNGFTFRGNLNYNYSDNDYKVLADIKDVNGNILETANVKRFHDRYRSVTARMVAGVVNKKFADQLLLEVIASGDDNQIQNGATMARVYGVITQESKSIINGLKYKKKDLFVEGLDVSLNSAYNINTIKTIDTLTGKVYNWYGEQINSNSQTDGEKGAPVSDLKFDNTEFTNQLNIGYLVNKHHSLSFNHAYQYFNRKEFDSKNPAKQAYFFPKSLYKNVLGLAYKYDFNQKWNTTLFGKAYLLKVNSSKEEGTNSETYIKNTILKNNIGYGVASSYFLLPNLQLKISYEHTYRMPLPDEIFGDGLLINSSENLGPEQSDNFNFNVGYNFNVAPNHHLDIKSTFVYRNAKDLIYEKVTVSSPQTNFENLAEARTIGIEGNINYKWKDFFNLGANVTYQNITDQADQTYSDYSGYQENFNKGARLPNTPYFFGNVNAGFNFKDVLYKETSLNLNYYLAFVNEYYLGWARYGNADDKATIPQQLSHNFEIAYSLKNNKYNISFECRNLTDEILYDKYRLQKPGRAFYLKLRYSL
ncbi:outer membrane receptor protein involved in Fe transport [Wenyingzhuangia heitensis]|uniref:Outer membrane receptor protein involved in Fe transport n=1 Tax=Wenyingzhuangia heitensis TaxID=1487859 RepID=A0ABX0U6M4_9FLAO|nr:TonB-dependent receptor [Wenyingzhuangia heitensis]NIJ44442.1 outer membrane receptor protein involved in Fe transport [Wenyingzhuangia heitensis]